MNEIQQIMQMLYDRDGDITPSAVLREAEEEEKASPLRRKFEWDDSVGGREYRLIQARKLIKTITIEFEGEQSRLVHVPSIRQEEGSYKPVHHVVKVEDEFERALNEVLTLMNSIQRLANAMQEAAKTHGTDESVHIAVIMKSLNTAESAMKMITAH